MTSLKLNPQNGNGRARPLVKGGHVGLWRVTLAPAQIKQIEMCFDNVPRGAAPFNVLE